MTAFLVFASAGLVTYLLRGAFILALGSRRLPDVVEVALRYVGPAVLAALTTSLLVSDGVAAYLKDPAAVAATGVALGAGLRRANMVVVLTVGMVTLWVVRALTS